MFKSKLTLWRPTLVSVLLAFVFIAFHLHDPSETDAALTSLSRRWVGMALSKIYIWKQAPPIGASVVVGLFDDGFKEKSQQPPTLGQYATLIDRLSEFDAREIVFDMDMRIPRPGEQHDHAQLEALERALLHAHQKDIRVILPLMPRDEPRCLQWIEDRPAQSPQAIQCAATARGAVQFFAEDVTSHYPLYMLDGHHNDNFVASLAWAAYLEYVGLPYAPYVIPGARDFLNDDVFPAWRLIDNYEHYPFCSFAVSQLLYLPEGDDYTCPEEPRKLITTEPKADSIAALVKDKSC